MYSGKRIDAHTHCIFDDDWDRIFAFLDARNITKMNCICGGPQHSALRVPVFKHMWTLHPDRFSWGTYLPTPDFSIPASDYVRGVIEHLKRAFGEGASSCKAFRNIGMEVRKPDGAFIMIDDPLFDPIFDYIASVDRVLVVHMAEPFSRWPSWPDDDPAFTGRKLYTPLPESDCPGFRQQILAQENMIRKHPGLRVVCAHLAALGYDVREVARMLDRCPNMAVDTSARRRELAVQDRQEVRDFFQRYQDRIIWGMDQFNTTVMSQASEAEKDGFFEMMGDGYGYEFGLYESEDTVDVDELRVQGLGLPDDVLEKFYHVNAEYWLGI